MAQRTHRTRVVKLAADCRRTLAPVNPRVSAPKGDSRLPLKTMLKRLSNGKTPRAGLDWPFSDDGKPVRSTSELTQLIREDGFEVEFASPVDPGPLDSLGGEGSESD